MDRSDNRPFAPAAARNADAILAALRVELRDRQQVLELGAGTGQHALRCAAELPALEWQPSEHPAGLPTLEAGLAGHDLPNLAAPVALDASRLPEPTQQYDAVFSANTLHIMDWTSVEKLFDRISAWLSETACVCIYGPFSIDAMHISPGNESFDRTLRGQGGGIRDTLEVDRLARSAGLSPGRCWAMPANNLLLVWNTAAAGAR